MNTDLLRKSSRLGSRTRFLLSAGTALPLALVAAPAQAACTVEGDTTTCTGDLSTGVGTNTPNVVVSDLSGDITPPVGFSAIWMGDVAHADINTGGHALDVQGAGAVVADTANPVELNFTGTINVTGLDPANNASSGIMVTAYQNGGSDARVHSTGNITVDITQDSNSATWGNRVIVALAGAHEAAVTSAGDLSVTVAGEVAALVKGIEVAGEAGAGITNAGNVTVSAEKGYGDGLAVLSAAASSVDSVGDITVDFGASAGYGISANGTHNTISSQGNISADGGGIVAQGQLIYDQNGNIVGMGVAEVTEVTSTGDISVSEDGAGAIVALGNDVTVNSTGALTTSGDLSSGIIAMRDYGVDPNTGEVYFDDAAQSVSVTSEGNITTAGDGSLGIAAGAGGGTATVTSVGDISTAGEFGIGIGAAGQAVTIESDGSITTGGAYGHGIIVAGDFAMVGEDPETMAPVAGDIAITAGDVSTSGMAAMGIRAFSSDGDIAVTANSVATSGHEDGEGNFAEAVFAESISGTASVDVGDASAEGFAASGVVALGGAGAHIVADSASAAGQQAAALYASSANGAVSVDAGTVTLRGDQQAGINALAYGGAATVTVESVVGEGTLANGVFAEATGGVSVTSGTIVAQRNGIAALGLDDSDVAILTTGDTTTETGHAIYGSGGNVAVTTAEGAITRGGTSGIRAVASDSVTIVNGGTAIATADLGSAIHVTAAGAVSIASEAVEVTGAGAWPGERGDGSNLRLEQGGIIVEGGAGAIAIDAGTVDIGGEHRYGISARGSGAISISVDSVDLASPDAAAVAARGGEGDVSITTGTIITTGPSGTGLVAETTSGAIAIDAGTTRIESDGMAGPFTGEAIYAASGTGTVNIVAADTFNAAYGGSALIGISAGDVTIESGIAETTGDLGMAVYAQSSGGDSTVRLGTLTASGEGAAGAYVRADAGEASLVTSGDVTAAEGYAIRGQGASVSIETGAGTTTSGTTGIRIHNGITDHGSGPVLVANPGAAEITNLGTVIGTGSGLGSGAISVVTSGDIGIVSNALQSTGDSTHGILAQSTNGNVTIDSGSIVLTGDQPPLFVVNPDGTFTLSDYSAIRAIAFNGNVDLRVDDITAAGELGRGIFAQARNVNIIVDGTIVADSAIIASSVDQAGSVGTVNVIVNGDITGSAAGMSTLGQAVVEVAEGASVTGNQFGIVMSDSQSPIHAQLYNSGTIEASEGPAVGGSAFSQQADFYIQNNGVLIGGGGIAVQTVGGNDTLELTNLSQITGIADLGDGDDRLVLDFNDDAPAGAVGQVVSTVNVEGLSVDTGSWVADGFQSQYGFVDIEQGTTLTVVQNEDGELAIATDLVELEGVLRVDVSVDEADGDLDHTTIAGSGSLHLVGSAKVELGDAAGLLHTGGTFVENGELLLNAVYGGDITTSGQGVFELGAAGDFTGNLINDGTFVFSRDSDYSFLGDFSGSGVLRKDGDSTLTFAGLYAFEGSTSVLDGSVAFTGPLSEETELDLTGGTVDLSQVEGGEQTISELQGSGGILQLGQTQLVIEQMGNSVFSGEILGLGTLLKQGEGNLDLSGDGTGFAGTGQVGGGTLSVNGDFSNANFVVDEGGTLGGAGTVGATSVNGGTLAPGNSIGTLTVNGDVAFTAASVYEVEVDPAGNADRIDATGTATLGGAAVNVIAENGTYRPLTDYTILTAAAGVSGTFGSVQDNLAFLDPSLIYSADAVTLRLVRNDIDFAALAGTGNEGAIVNLVESFGYGNALYNEVLTLVDGNVSASFASLTGEVYPAYGAVLIETAEVLRRQTAGAAPAAEGAFAWATGLYNQVDSGSGTGNIGLTGRGVAGGFGFGAGGFSASAGMGRLDQDRGGSQFRDGEITFAIGRLAWNGATGLSVSAGAQLGWVDGQTRRQTTLGAINQAVTGRIDGDYVQLFGEIGYRMPVGDGLVAEPFAGLSHVSLDLDGVSETGAPTALAIAAIDRDVTFADLGLRVSGEATTGVHPYASAAYRHAWGDRASVAAFGFAGLPGSALVGAVPIARSAADLSAGLLVTSGSIDFEIGYDATISEAFDSHGVSAGLKARF